MYRLRYEFIYVTFLLCFSHNLEAGIEEEQALSFGKLVILSNTEVETIRIDKSGNISYSDAFRIIESPVRARFRIFDLPADTPVNISFFIRQTTLTSDVPNLERFTFDSLDHFDLVITDEFGEAVIWVGGQISTSGLGSTNYGTNVPLTADYRFTIDY